jgi:tRNA A37 threonylcarbamoyladenosine biosynthesis protein TsaE
MKPIQKITIVMAIILNAGLTHGLAQSNNCAAYWVIEGNIHQPTYTLLRFYTSEHLLIHEDRLNGKFLYIRKKKNRDFLDRKLNELKCPKMEENIARLKRKKRFH